MKGYHDSTTEYEHRDSWQTPKFIFDFFDDRYQFSADVCASRRNALCDVFYTIEDDCLSCDWSESVPRFSTVWCNPPYSRPKEFINKAHEQNQKNRIWTAMLLPADTSVSWFSLCEQLASEIIFITDGRISFINPQTGKPKSGNSKGSMLAIFGVRLGACKISTLSMKQIKAQAK